MCITALDINKIRNDFPILSSKMNGKDLVFLDNAASTQKPMQVIARIKSFYDNEYANIHRGTYKLAEHATQEYENTRKKIQNFINASNHNEIVFTKGTTDGVNLLAYSLGQEINSGDEIVITTMEHHANIVPWQMLCQQKGAVLKVIPINPNGELILDNLSDYITENTKILSLVHISNTLGTINPVKQLIDFAHSFGAYVIIDGAQSIQHKKIDVQELDCDFYVFSAHKLYAPTGVGVLYGKKDILEKIPPYQTGGEMISKVTFEKTTFNSLPYKFEAGTPNIAGVIGLGAAIDYLNEIGLDKIDAYEQELLTYSTEKLLQIEGFRIVGTASNKASVLSFLIEGIHPTDIGTMADAYGIAMRVGHHCTQPLMDFYGIPGTCRASFAFYNTKEEIDFLYDSILRIKKLLG